jgi:hypothetical protein
VSVLAEASLLKFATLSIEIILSALPLLLVCECLEDDILALDIEPSKPVPCFLAAIAALTGFKESSCAC